MKNKILHQSLSVSFALFAIALGTYSSLIACQEELDETFGNDPATDTTHLLFDTIRDNDLTAFTELINEKDADVNAGSRRHHLSPLAFAIKRDACYEIVLLLLAKGAYLDATNFALLSPYMHAVLDVFSGNLAGVKSVIKSTTDCKQAEKEGFFLLHAAAYSGHLDMVQFLVNSGFSVHQRNTRNQNPVFLAAYAGHKNIVKYFIAKGAELNRRDRFGLSVLEAACIHGHQPVVRTLLVYGSQLNCSPNERRIHPLFIAACGGHKNTAEDFILLREDINQPSHYGRRPLHAAANGGHLDTVELLVSYGAEIDSTDDDGNTPLHFATLQNHCVIISYLVKHGADSYRQNKQGKTPFDYILDFRHNVRTALRRKLPENCVLEIALSIPLEYSISYRSLEDNEENQATISGRSTKRQRVA